MAMLGRADEPPFFVGGFGDYFLLPAGAVVYTVPDAVPDEVACGANCALSQVMYGLERVDQRLGEMVVVQGAGALGLYAVAVAKARGAARVIAVNGVPERLELARAFGADDVIDLNAAATVKDRVKIVRELTDGQGADVVVEVVGHPSAIDEGLKMLGSSVATSRSTTSTSERRSSSTRLDSCSATRRWSAFRSTTLPCCRGR
jgi:threonine dehydrogenase-like Zn-dependent dehydrogenase